jgi:hypothetical protein
MKNALAQLEAGGRNYENFLQTVSSTTAQALAIHSQQISISGLLYRSIAATVASNKYALLQNMASMGLLRLVVSDGEIETRINFSTWDEHETRSESSERTRDVSGSFKFKKTGLGILLNKTNFERSRSVKVTTTKNYERDTSGSKVDIYGRVLIRFKTDYLPLNPR